MKFRFDIGSARSRMGKVGNRMSAAEHRCPRGALASSKTTPLPDCLLHPFKVAAAPPDNTYAGTRLSPSHSRLLSDEESREGTPARQCLVFPERSCHATGTDDDNDDDSDKGGPTWSSSRRGRGGDREGPEDDRLCAAFQDVGNVSCGGASEEAR